LFIGDETFPTIIGVNMMNNKPLKKDVSTAFSTNICDSIQWMHGGELPEGGGVDFTSNSEDIDSGKYSLFFFNVFFVINPHFFILLKLFLIKLGGIRSSFSIATMMNDIRSGMNGVTETDTDDNMKNDEKTQNNNKNTSSGYNDSNIRVDNNDPQDVGQGVASVCSQFVVESSSPPRYSCYNILDILLVNITNARIQNIITSQQ
jgi:hypothetical protein